MENMTMRLMKIRIVRMSIDINMISMILVILMMYVLMKIMVHLYNPMQRTPKFLRHATKSSEYVPWAPSSAMGPSKMGT